MNPTISDHSLILSFSQIPRSGEKLALVGGNGDPVSEEEGGLLRYDGATVCATGFSYSTARAVCRGMAFQYKGKHQSLTFLEHG